MAALIRMTMILALVSGCDAAIDSHVVQQRTLESAAESNGAGADSGEADRRDAASGGTKDARQKPADGRRDQGDGDEQGGAPTRLDVPTSGPSRAAGGEFAGLVVERSVPGAAVQLAIAWLDVPRDSAALDRRLELSTKDADSAGGSFRVTLPAAMTPSDALAAPDDFMVVVVSTATTSIYPVVASDGHLATTISGLGVLSIRRRPSGPGAFALTGPAATGNEASPTATWAASAGAVRYEYRIATGGACGSTVAAGTVTGTSTTALAALTDGGYTLCVDAFGADGGRTSAAPRAFTIDTQPPGAFTVTTPTVVDTYAVTIQWTPSADAAGYQITVDTVASCDSAQARGASAGAATTSAAVGLLEAGSYFVCVEAIDAAGNPRLAGGGDFAFQRRRSWQGEVETGDPVRSSSDNGHATFPDGSYAAMLDADAAPEEDSRVVAFAPGVGYTTNQRFFPDAEYASGAPPIDGRFFAASVETGHAVAVVITSSQQLWVRRFTAGIGWMPAEHVDLGAVTADWGNENVAFAANGDILLPFSSTAGGNTTTQAVAFRAMSGTWSAPVELAPTGQALERLAIAPDGRAHAVTTFDTGPSYDIRAYSSADWQTWPATPPVLYTCGDRTEFKPLMFTAGGIGRIVFNCRPSIFLPESDIVVSTWSGSAWQAPSVLGSDANNMGFDQPALLDADGILTVVWGTQSGSGTYARRMQADGSMPDPAEQLFTGASVAPLAAVDAAGNVVALAYDGSPDELVARRFDVTTGLWDRTSLCGGVTSRCFALGVSALPDGRVAVVSIEKSVSHDPLEVRSHLLTPPAGVTPATWATTTIEDMRAAPPSDIKTGVALRADGEVVVTYDVDGAELRTARVVAGSVVDRHTLISGADWIAHHDAAIDGAGNVRVTLDTYPVPGPREVLLVYDLR
jgi:hypothetical protein